MGQDKRKERKGLMQPLEAIYKATCHITYFYRYKRQDIVEPLKTVGKYTSVVAALLLAIPTVTYTMIPTTVKADEDDITREVLKLEGTKLSDTSALKEQVLVQKSTEQGIDYNKVDTDKSVVVAVHPAPVTKPTIQTVTFKAKLVKSTTPADNTKKENTDESEGKVTKDSFSTVAETMKPEKEESNKAEENKGASDKGIEKETKEETKSTAEPTATPQTESELDNSDIKVVKTDDTKSTEDAVKEDSKNNANTSGTTDEEKEDKDTDKNTDKEADESESIVDETKGIDLTDVNVSVVGENNKDADLSDTTNTVNVENKAASKPVLKIREALTIDKGDGFNPTSLIQYTQSSNNTLPALQVESNVNTDKAGKYTVTIKATDSLGNTEEKKATITVRVNEKREAEEKKYNDELKEAAVTATRKKHIDEVRAAGGLYTEEGNREIGSDYNPYPGWNYNNCTWGAWQLAHDNIGINLPKWGNAAYWLAGAQASGYATGSIPKEGSIVVMGSGMGHVAYVDKVSSDGKQIYVKQGSYTNGSGIPWSGSYSETWQNAYGYAVSGKPILGYIYLK